MSSKPQRSKGVEALAFIKEHCQNRPELVQSMLTSGDRHLSGLFVQLCINILHNPEIKLHSKEKEILRKHKTKIQKIAAIAPSTAGDKLRRLLRGEKGKSFPTLILIRAAFRAQLLSSKRQNGSKNVQANTGKGLG